MLNDRGRDTTPVAVAARQTPIATSGRGLAACGPDNTGAVAGAGGTVTTWAATCWASTT